MAIMSHYFLVEWHWNNMLSWECIISYNFNCHQVEVHTSSSVNKQKVCESVACPTWFARLGIGTITTHLPKGGVLHQQDLDDFGIVWNCHCLPSRSLALLGGLRTWNCETSDTSFPNRKAFDISPRCESWWVLWGEVLIRVEGGATSTQKPIHSPTVGIEATW